MVALICLVLGVIVVLAAAGVVGRLLMAGLWALAGFGFLLWLAVSPDPQAVLVAKWLLVAWLATRLARVVRRLRRPSA